MVNFPIVDTHVHLWDTNSGRIGYPWLGDLPPLNRPFLVNDFDDARGSIEVEKIVFLECDVAAEDAGEEAKWVAEIAQTDSRIQGIVAGGQLENGEGVRPYLEELKANPLVKGVRRLIQKEENIEFCIQPDFVKGVQILEDYGFSFDICIYHPQVANTVKLVSQCPNVQFILDHIGKPDIAGQVLEPWKSGIKQLSDFPNVRCKVSGMTTEADHENWTRDDLKPYIDHVIECFSFDRVIYGGDWPVATLATEYPRWVETLDWAVEGCSDIERNKLFHDNAVEFYRL